MSLQSQNTAPPIFSNDENLQDYLLQGVSRTFALTIPQLPAELCKTVSNGYLLCRIIDTIEDDPALNFEQKRDLAQQFVDIVAGTGDVQHFSKQLAPLLSDATIPAEHELISLTPQVIKITHSFNSIQREALSTCVKIMADGMIHYQEVDTSKGLASLDDMEQYCYHVAGVVGEMLCKLFCAYSPEINQHYDKLIKLSVAFGQGLQMTNILKDIWDDQRRGACWLPQDVFTRHNFDLADLKPGMHNSGFEQGLEELTAIGFNCLQQALEYTLLIPRSETGIRNFCFWAIGMAELTLRKVHQNKQFSDGAQVKITRRSVKLTIAASKIAVYNDLLLRALFNFAGRGLPHKKLESIS
ncbi:MAG: phytoene/squalene synthase family protein [Gammaproteobacteria bacterium]